MSLHTRYVLSLIIICVLVITPKSQATLQLLGNCLSTIGDIPGCVEEVITSILTIQIRIGPQCCRAVLDVEDNCWGQVFPLITSTFPLSIRRYCTRPRFHQLNGQLSAEYSAFSPAPTPEIEDAPPMSNGMDA